MREGEEKIKEIEKEADDIELHEAYAVVWLENSPMNCFVGFALSKDNDGTTFENLERKKKLDNLLWQ